MSNVIKSYHNKSPLSNYVVEHSLRNTPVEKDLQELTFKHARYVMMGDPLVLQLTSNLMKSIGAKRMLDVGSFTGLSALSAALALPDDGEVITMDITDEYVKLGKPHWKKSGVENKITSVVAPALDTLQNLIDEGKSGSFDFAFIDADKQNYCNYYELCLSLIRSGGIIAIDNTIWSGDIINDNDQSESTVGIRAINDKLRDDTRIDISFLMIGDGLTLCFKK